MITILDLMTIVIFTIDENKINSDTSGFALLHNFQIIKSFFNV